MTCTTHGYDDCPACTGAEFTPAAEIGLTCQYCHATEHSATSFAHHVCDKNVLRDRIAGQEAHMRMWHAEALRLAKKYNEDTFYHPVSRHTAPPRDFSAQALPVPSAEERELPPAT